MRAWWSIVVLAGVFGVSIFALSYLKLNNAPDIYFPHDNPAVVFDHALRKQFPQDQVLVVLFEGSNIFSAHFLKALDAVAKRIEASPLVNRVFVPSTMDHIAGTADGFAVEPLVDVHHLTGLNENAIRKRVLSDRFAPGLVVARDGSAVALVVRPIALKNSLQRLKLQRLTLAAVHDAGLSKEVVAVAGQVALDVAEMHSMIRDTAVFVPLLSAVGLLLIWWLFRRWIAVVLSAVTMGSVVALTVALLVVWGRPFSLVSAIIAPFMMALTIALLIHFFHAIAHYARSGRQGAERAELALAQIGRPALFATLTTVAGLLSLGLSPVQPIQTFGVVSGLGLLYMHWTVTRLLPPLLIQWDRLPWSASHRSARWIERSVRWLARLAMRRAGWVVVGSALLLVVGAPFIWRVHVETDLYRFFGPNHPLTRSTHLVEQKLAGVSPIEVVFDGPGRDSLKDPGRLKAIKHFQTWLDSQSGVSRTLSLPDFVEEMNWAFHSQNPQFRRIPDNRRLISQYLFIYDGHDLYDLVDRNFDRTLVTVSLSLNGADEIGHMIQRIRNHLVAHPVADLKWRITGLGRLFADQQTLLIKGQIRSLWSAVVLIFFMMVILWRSFRDAVLCMIPNVAPILLIFMVMGAANIWLDMATAMIASIAVGIAVDDTIHLFHEFSRHRAAGRGIAFSLARSYRREGQAVVATTVILSAQFLLLTRSAFVPTEEFGLLTCVGLLSALLFDLLLLPALLVLLARNRGQRVRAGGG